MIAYSFTITDGLFSNLVNGLGKGETKYCLRESLQEKEIGIFEDMNFSELESSGRIFTDTWELRYRKIENQFNCLLVSDETLHDGFENISFQSQEVKALYDIPKAYFVESLKAIVKGESIFKEDKFAQVLMKEYQFTDAVGGSCYRLCGVR